MKMSKESTSLMQKIEITFGTAIREQVEKSLFVEPIKAIEFLPSEIIKAVYGYDPYTFIYQNNNDKSYFVLQKTKLSQLEDTINIDLFGFILTPTEQMLTVKKHNILCWTPSTFTEKYSVLTTKETLQFLKSCKEYLNCLSDFSDSFRFINSL